MIKGFDISKWQGKRAVSTALSKVPDAQFCIIKATEGRTYCDPNWQTNVSDALNAGLMIGLYHYARPENGNSPKEEATHFVLTVNPYIGKAMLALDFEGVAHKYGVDWAIEWLDEVYRLTSVRPVIYLSGSYVAKYGSIASKDYGLWIAAWCGEEKAKRYISGWSTFAVWQYSNSGGELDLDYFNGEPWQFMMYEAIEEDEPTDEELGNGFCGCCCECCKK